MINQAKPFFLHAISSIHPGSGSEVGIVDLPVQREQHTNYPKIESSSLKGAIRATVSNVTGALNGDNEMKRRISYIFGIDPEEVRQEKGKTQAGAITFADARILLFPVKSLRGVFAWVTCPFVLQRLNREMGLYSEKDFQLPVPETPSAASRELFVMENRVVLEEYTFDVTQSEETAEIAEKLQEILFPGEEFKLSEHLLVLDDDAFRDFVTLSTEVNARVRIDSKTGTVSGNALWYEENIPPETVFYSFMFAGNVRGEGMDGLKTHEDVMSFMSKEQNFPAVFQLGGNATIGRGMLQRIWL